MRRFFAGLAYLLIMIVVAEFFFAASGAFGSEADRAAFRPHHALGYVIFLLPLAMAAVAVLGRMPGRLTGLTLLVPGLVAVQVVIAKVAIGMGAGSVGGQVVFGLHAIGGLGIVLAAGLIVRQVRVLNG